MPNLIQPTLFDLLDAPPESVADAVEMLASNGSAAARGAVFTRSEVVDFVLDLVGYTTVEPLHLRRIPEPSCGAGDFLLPAIKRLLVSWRRHGGRDVSASRDLGNAVRAVELHRETADATRHAIMMQLRKEGLSAVIASQLAGQWLVQGDFLLEPQNFHFDYIVGNPPYVRQELIPAPLQSEYRRRYQTMYDRADLYVPFIERSLSLLTRGGTLGFICADRWMKNRYGGPLREYVSRHFHLAACIDMTGTEAFHSDVSAYPAIVILTRSSAGVTRVAHRPRVERKALASVMAEFRLEILPENASVREMTGVVHGSAPWLLAPADQTSLIRRIESRFPGLEQVGCRVGIGVATGADGAFIGDFETMDVEPGRKLPLVTTRDIRSGKVAWHGLGVIQPFASDGRLVRLQDFPRLAR